MKFSSLILAAALGVSNSSCAVNKSPDITSPGNQTVTVPDNATHAQIIELSTECKPHPRQLFWQQLEYTCFIHFGPNTFSGVEWGNGKENAAIFNPGDLDTDQWCHVAKEAGMKLIMITTKHHDGFCTWQTRYNDKFSVKATPWRQGKGDVLRELVNSARKYGLKVGVYVSPADLFQIESKDGLYGNRSKYQNSVIPTDPASFKTNPMKKRDVAAGKPTFNYKVDDYNRYFLNQLYELLTEYGEIHEVWFDGAHPKRKGGQTYTYQNWYSLIRKLAPKAVIQGKGPDARWIGNEHGGTRQQEWSALPLYKKYGEWLWPDRTGENIAREDKLKNARAIHWYPAELDVSIRHGWFWRNEKQHVRSADNVFDIYERGVGSNAVVLLNVPPNQDGKFSKRDVDCLLEVGKRIRQTYGVDLLDGAITEKHLRDGNIETSWSEGSSFVINLPKQQVMNRFVLQEAVITHGQRVKAHALDAWLDGAWKEVAKGETIGYKKIMRFPEVTTTKLRVRITDSRAKAVIAEVAAHYYAQPPLPVRMSRLGKDEIVLQQNGKSQQKIHYTVDGSEPTLKSPVYKGPLSFPQGATLKARSVSGETLGGVASFYIGVDRSKWKVSTSSSQSSEWSAAKAIDGNPKTFWHTSWSKKGEKHPHTLSIDLGEVLDVTAFSYLPRQDRSVPDSMIEKFRIEGSVDGKSWFTCQNGTFGNLLNDPSARIFWFKKKHKMRFFRLVSLAGVQGKPYAGFLLKPNSD